MTQDVEKPRITNAATEPEEHRDIEVTQEMIDVAAEVLLMDSFLEISRTTAEHLATEMLRRAFQAYYKGSCEDDP